MTLPKKPAETFSAPSSDYDALPPRVAALRLKILEAVAKGDIEALRIPIEWAETPPSFARGPERPRGFGPIIEFLKNRSFDGKGQEVLAITRAVFEAPYVKQTRGTFETYIWPSFARAPLTSLSEDERLHMWRCVRFADVRASSLDGRPLMQMAGIGQDGTWHYYWSIEEAATAK